MLRINVLLSSLILIPVWLISLRFMPKPASFYAILIAGLTSFHIYYPRLIMSENLHVPLFSFSVLLLLSSGEGSTIKKLTINILFGVAMALGYLTKYLYLVAIPVLVLLWWIKPLFDDNPEERRITVTSRFLDFTAIVAGFSVTYFPWLMYVQYSHISLAQGFGAEFVSSGIPDVASWKSLALWVNFYVSYCVVALSPCLLVLSLYLFMLSTGRIKNERRETFFIITVILLSFIFMATAIQHSWRAKYNYPLPAKILGRYLMHLMPLWIILFMISLNKIKDALHRLNFSHLILCFLLVSVALFYSFAMLTLIQDASGLWFSFYNSPEIQMFMERSSALLLVTMLFTMFGVLAAGRRNNYLRNRFIHLFAMLLILIQISSSYIALKKTLSGWPNSQLHGQALSLFVKQESEKNSDKIVVISNVGEISRNRLPLSIKFWLSAQSSQPYVTFISLEEYFSDTGNWPDKMYILTKPI